MVSPVKPSALRRKQDAIRAWFSGPHERVPWQRVLFLFVALLVLHASGFARFHTYNNQTFDLAMYTRMAWGMVRLDFWDPFMNAQIAGLHVSPVLIPVGLLGLVFGTAATLLFSQALSCVLAAAALGKMGERHLGKVGWWVGALALIVHPNLGHVISYEAHPGTLALFPLALAVERLDAKSKRGFIWACVGVIACREDLALVTALLGVLALRSGWQRVGRWVGLGSLLYFLAFALILHPQFGPSSGSFEAHFGGWGHSIGDAVLTWLTDPLRVLAHLAEPDRLIYLPMMLAPLAFLPVLGGRWLLPTLPIVAINLLSFFPTTTQHDSHYFTPALPFFVAAAIVGAQHLSFRRELDRRVPILLVLGAVLGLGFALLGVRPGSARFRTHEATLAGRDIVRAIERRDMELNRAVSVQAPDVLLAHLAERPVVHRGPPPDRNVDFVVLDLRHRSRFRGSEDLLRTTQEPGVRAWLARSDYGVTAFHAPWLLLERGADSRALLAGREETAERTHRLCDCLSVGQARETADRLELVLVAHGPCPNDLALRIDDRVDLLFEGWFSPAHLRDGDVFRSHHALRTSPGSLRTGSLRTGSLRIGALRSSGARPSPDDPVFVELEVQPFVSDP